MNVSLKQVSCYRGDWQLSADGMFDEGIHLVSGRVGSGKSTLALLLAGLIKPERGIITSDHIATRMLSLQFPEYHVTEQTIEREIFSWKCPLSAFTWLPEDRLFDHPLSLSRGELKRLLLTCILSKTWDLLILDEPFSSLDCLAKTLLCRQLEISRHGITIIFTHEQCILPRVDVLWEMMQGQLMYRGQVPGAIPSWTDAPPHIRKILDYGGIPENIRVEDAARCLSWMRE